MKPVDLVVVDVGDDHRLGGVGIVDHAHELAADAQLGQPLQVDAAVLADGGHRQRRAAEQLEAVGDVAGAAAKIATQ